MDDAFSREELLLAFSHHIAHQVVKADGKLHPSEAEWLAVQFPHSILVEAGFVDDEGHTTPRYGRATREGVRTAGTTFSESDRRAMMFSFAEVAVGDLHYHWREGNVLRKAAVLLGLSGDALQEVLRACDAPDEEGPGL
jgi:uncharacterized tellurite resistance protein B-like protein